ncbi:Fc.00g060030.m01.CDS01 [Cosmosporella sp. VM-42]
MASIPTVPNHGWSTVVDRHRIKFLDLAPEILLEILERLPSISSLRSTIEAHPRLYDVFKTHADRVSTEVLRNELPSQVYAHAVVAYLALGGNLAMPNLDGLKIDEIGFYVNKVRSLRDIASEIKIPLLSAVSITEQHRMVTCLTDLCIRDCACSRDQDFPPLWDSLQKRKPSATERIRIQQSIYLFQILASLCKNLYFEKDANEQYYVDYYVNLGELHICLLEIALAPWEMYQVISIQAFFRRALHGFERDAAQSERIMPCLLKFGIKFLHHALCIIDEKHLDDFLAPFEKDIRMGPQYALGMVLSRGARDTWTRQHPKNHNEYSPFWSGDKDAGYVSGVQSWKNLEAKQMEMFRDEADWNDLFDHDLQLLEGRLDLWSAALWDEDRWEDIRPSLRIPEPSYWNSLHQHNEPMTLGFHIMRHPGVLDGEEGVEG